MKQASISGATDPARHAAIALEPKRRSWSNAMAIRPKARCETGSTERSVQADVIVVLRVPVPVKVIPAFRMRANLLAKLVSDGLGGGLNRRVPREIGSDFDGIARERDKAPAANTADETRDERRAGQAREHNRCAQKPGVAIEKGHANTVAAKVSIHEKRDKSVLRKRPADLKRSFQGLAHFERLDAEQVAD